MVMRGNPPARYCSCGARLARDNTGTRCGPCQQKARSERLGPPHVPADFWDTDQLRDAFAERHMGQVCRAYRHHPSHGSRPLPQGLIAGWVGLAQTQLSRIEHGPPITDLDKLVHWARTLQIPPQYLWFDLPGRRRDGGEASVPPSGQPIFAAPTLVIIRADGLPWVWDETHLAEVIGEFTKRDLLVSRREAVRGMTVIAGDALTQPLRRWLDPTPATRMPDAAGPVGVEQVEQIEAAAGVFRDWETQHGGGLWRKAVIGQLSEVTELLREHHPAPVKQRLFLVAAELAQTAGSMSADAGLHANGQRYFVLAVQAAKAGRDAPLAANVLASMAWQMLDLDHPDDALDLIHLAQRGAGASAPATLRAMLYAYEGWVYAKLGRFQPFARAAGRAQEALLDSNPTEDPRWIPYFDEAELAGVLGARYRDLAHYDPRHARASECHIRNALDLRPADRVRNRAFDLTGLARTYVIQKEVDPACRLANEVLPMAKRLGSHRLLDRLCDLSREASAYSDIAEVRDLRERIADLLHP